ncbi:MAG: hypothetical protein ACF8PN_10245 [Phycisphaerales bacterium]
MFRRAAALVLLAAVSLPMTGCNIATGVAYAVEGPPKRDAAYTLPPESKIVVFLDDRATVIPQASFRRGVAMRATEIIVQEKRLVAGGITPTAATRVAEREAYDEPMAIDDIGREIGATHVIYVNPVQWTLVNNAIPQPVAVYRVKIIEVATGRRLWPSEEAGAAVVVQMAPKTDSQYSRDEFELLSQRLAEFSGLRIAELFYEHEPNPLDGRRSE